MKRKPVFRLLLIITVFIFLLGLFMPFILGTFIKSKVEKALNGSQSQITYHIESVRAYLFKSVIKTDSIHISTVSPPGSDEKMSGSIASMTCVDINLFRLFFKQDLDVEKIVFKNPIFQGTLSFKDSSSKPLISKMNIKIDSIVFDHLNVRIKEAREVREYNIRNGDLRLFMINIKKSDTISENRIGQLDLRAAAISMISGDSSYSVVADSMTYYPLVHVLFAEKFEIRPNFSFYGFTSRFPYETDRFEIDCRKLTLQHFDLLRFIKTGDLYVTSINIAKLNAVGFRDKRKPFRHLRKTSFQQLIRDFPGKLKVDTVSVKSGNIVYHEHAEKAKSPGFIKFTNVNLLVTNITNLNNAREKILQLTGNSLLMGEGLLHVELNAPLFNENDLFHMKGYLTEMEIGSLNPMLETNAFVSASGKLNKLNFEFTADTNAAKGKVTMLYQNMQLTVLDKNHDSTALKEQFLTLLVNQQVINSNPKNGRWIREGVIDYKRDPERFLFNYCFKALFTGIQSSITGNKKAKKK